MKRILFLFLLCCPFLFFAQTSILDVKSRLEGHWIQKDKSKTIYENWQMEGGQLNGSSSTQKNGKILFQEKLCIHQRDSQIYYSSLVAENQRWVDFELIIYNEKEMIFENPDHDFPTFIHYLFLGKDSLHVIVGDANRKLQFYYLRNKNMPCSSPEYRQFDFWLGDWEAFNTKGQKAGDSKISLILDGCVVLEEWQSFQQQGPRKYSGKSFNTYDATTGKWQQTWVDNHGGSTEFLDGQFNNNTLTFFTSPFEYKKDTITQRKLSFNKISNNEVRQWGELVMNGSQVLQTEYDFIYKRKSFANENTFVMALDTMMALYNRGNFLGLAQMYTDDAEIMGGSTFVKGRMNIDNYWLSLGKQLGGRWKLTHLNAAIDYKNKTATQRGRSEITAVNGSVSTVEFVLNWVETVEGWKIDQDIYW